LILRATVAFVLAAALVGWPTERSEAVTTEFPPGYEGYHTYAEMAAELDAAVAAYGTGPGAILKRYLIGKSYEGRNIWAIKISDNVAVDENEPEVLSESLMHAREHITLEMNLYLIRLLTQNYGKSTALGQRVTAIVNSREIWVIPLVNPDGAEYNISGGYFHGWRKNRQLNPGSSKIGIDLNRNFSFMWACCGGGSNKPRSARYRGRYPFEAVEAAVLRDFVLSRRIGGVQQLKLVLNWHSYGEFVIWPFGYTKEDVPKTMTLDDHKALVAIGRQMAALNGYRARQGSDSYIYDGDVTAWTYGDQRIISFTFEMYPRWGSKAGGFRPPDTVLERETTRNRDTILYALEQADCPYRAAGLGATRCGPLNDDFETGRGWAFAGGSGAFERGDPRRTATAAGVKQRGGVPSGLSALVTGAAAGANANANDVDGSTTALSPIFRLGGGAWTLRFRYTFAHSAAATIADYLRVSVVAGATTTPIWTLAGKSSERNARWRTKKLSLSAWAGQNVRLLIEARDGAADTIVEAALDDMRIYRTP
jgi:hypothetical protein